MPTFNRFDIVHAYYEYFACYHTGQYSNHYRRLSRLLTYFNPNGAELSDNGAEILSNLEQRKVK